MCGVFPVAMKRMDISHSHLFSQIHKNEVDVDLLFSSNSPHAGYL